MVKDKLIFRGRLLKVYVRKQTLPNGYKAHLEVVKHPGASLIIPFLTKDEIILLMQYRPVIDAYIYELPAGTLDKGEKPFHCAKREIIEETGYSAKKFKKLGDIYPVPGYSTEKISIFKAESLKKVNVRPEADEVIKTLICNRKQIKVLFKNRKIVDAKTICALAMCGWL